MEPIDWSKPIELMDRTRKFSFPEAAQQDAQQWYWILDNMKGGCAFLVDSHGCLGGVQVVRNRKEKRKLRVRGWVTLYEDATGCMCVGELYDSQETAQEHNDRAFGCIYIDRIVEEGEGL